jgi:crotonobetainyl-CoA:carnitine CoA-transferase CaiB-like acyl-CoA transferase
VSHEPPARGPLGGLRILERADGLPASYAGFLLGGLGAEVVKVEAPGAERAPRDHVLQRGKLSVALDGEPTDALWRTMLAGADAVLSNADVSADAGLVRGVVTGWGGKGHPRDLPADEALIAATGGVPALQWSWSKDPVWLVTPVVSYMTGMLAALGVTAALYARLRGASGQTIRVSGLGGAFALNSGTFVSGPGQQGSLSQYGDPRGVYPNYSFYPTADGWIFLGALTQAFWVKLMTALDRVDLLAHPLLQGNPLSFGAPELRTLVRGELDPIFVRRPTAEWLSILRDADVPCGPLESRAEALADPEARALGLVAEIDDPALGRTWQPAEPALFSDTPAPRPRPARRPGADTAAVRAAAPSWRRAVITDGSATPPGCLAGVRVLDLTSFIAGPFCPMLLADLGADVVKIESLDGDPFRLALYGFAGWNRGKRSLVVDLKTPAGRDVLLDLVRASDVVVDNYRAGVMERLGIGAATLAAANPRLVHTSITGYGSTGPLAALPGFDPVFQARTGLSHAQGSDEEPVLHMIAFNDYSAGALGALVTAAALVARERTGRGQRVELSLFRTGFIDQAGEMISYDGRPAPVRGGRDFVGPLACRRLYACGDGWLCVAGSTPAHAAALGRLCGMDVSLDDPADGAAALAVARLFAGEARAITLGRLAAAGVPAAPCLTLEELFTDAFLHDAGCWAEQEHPTLGRVVLSAPFIGFGGTPAPLPRHAPLLGAEGATVLGEIGYTQERIAALVASGVVGAPR